MLAEILLLDNFSEAKTRLVDQEYRFLLEPMTKVILSQDVNYETFLNELTILEGIVNNFMIYHMTVNQLFIWNDPYVSRE